MLRQTGPGRSMVRPPLLNTRTQRQKWGLGQDTSCYFRSFVSASASLSILLPFSLLGNSQKQSQTHWNLAHVFIFLLSLSHRLLCTRKASRERKKCLAQQVHLFISPLLPPVGPNWSFWNNGEKNWLDFKRKFFSLSFSCRALLKKRRNTWSQWEFGNLEAPVTNRKPYSLHQSQSLIMVHGDLPVIWPFQSMYTVNCNSQWQLYYIHILPSYTSLCNHRLKMFSQCSREVHCIL